MTLGALMALMFSGCLGSPPVPDDVETASKQAAKARPVVVAVIDSGINPYHEAFRAAPGAGVEHHLGAFGLEEAVQLSVAGTHADHVDADKAFWENVEPVRLYAFEGTRVLAISITRFPGTPSILDVSGHGTEVAFLAVREAPDAIVLSIQTDNSFCPIETGECPLIPPVSEAMAWAAEQPWIDIISVSLGYPGNPPMPQPLSPEIEAYLSASRLAHERGKVIVTGTGNTVVPPLASYFAGPPWVIAVGGVEAAPRGEAPDASKAPDVAANFSEYMPTHNSVDEYGWGAGTSYSTPIVAGTLAQALHDVRAKLGHVGGITEDGALAVGKTPQGESMRVTSKELRDALNATGLYFSPTEWDPTKPTSNRTYNFLYQSVPVVVPFAQMGWGYVHGGLASEIAARVLAGDSMLPADKATAAVYMAQRQAVRESYWQTVSGHIG